MFTANRFNGFECGDETVEEDTESARPRTASLERRVNDDRLPNVLHTWEESAMNLTCLL